MKRFYVIAFNEWSRKIGAIQTRKKETYFAGGG